MSEYLFVSIKKGKSFWINPKNIEGSFQNNCYADIFSKNGEYYVSVIDEKITWIF